MLLSYAQQDKNNCLPMKILKYSQPLSYYVIVVLKALFFFNALNNAILQWRKYAEYSLGYRTSHLNY